MKIFVIISLSMLFTSLDLSSQTDTIYKMNGEVIHADVTGINESSILFQYPNESFSNTVNKSAILKIHFKSGRIEEFAMVSNLSIVKSCLDWEAVQISSIPSEVEGLFKIDDVSTKAEGNTEFASIGKMQSRALNKIKIQTAMIGGNVCFITHQNTEGSGYYNTANVAISAVAYTSKKVFEDEIISGNYTVKKIYLLKSNAYDLTKVNFPESSCSISKGNIYFENGFPKIDMRLNEVNPSIKTYTIIYASEIAIVLSGIYRTNNGKTSYYNAFLKKD